MRPLSRRSTPLLPFVAPAAACALISIGPRAALAGPDPVQVSYAFEGPCPDQTVFLDALYSRTHRVRPAALHERSWIVRVSVRAQDNRASGVVRVDGPNGMATTRELSADSCAEVVSALAFVAALAIDPGADAPAVCAAQSSSQSMSPTRPVLEDDWTGREPPADVPASGGEATSRPWVAGAQFISMGAIAPHYLPGALVHVGYEPNAASTLAARIRLSLAYVPPGSVESSSGEARFGWAGAHVDGCPIGAGYGRIGLYPCIAFAVGWTRSEGLTQRGAAADLAWADIGMLLRFRIDVSEWLVVDADGALFAPLTRHTYVFDHPTSQVFQTPRVAGVFGVGLASRFQ